MRILALLTDGFGGYGGIAQYNRFLYSLRALRLALQYKPDLIFCGIRPRQR